MVVTSTQTLSEIRNELQQLTGIEKDRIRLGKSSYWAGTPRNQLEALRWEHVAPNWTSAACADESALTALCLRDSDVYYYKDADEVVMLLSDEETLAAQAEAKDFALVRKAQTTSSYSSSSKEKGLKIKKSS